MPKIVEKTQKVKKEKDLKTKDLVKKEVKSSNEKGKAETTKKIVKDTKKASKPKSTLAKVRTEKKEAKKENRIIKEADLRKEALKESELPKKYLLEYYDLPYRYDETVVTILAQTPKRLFVYWDVSDKDKEKYRKAFGEDFFEKTYPVLLIHNEELNYTYEVPINDFANSWYLDIKDSKTKYVVQLGRKFRNVREARNNNSEVIRKENISLQNDYIYITSSNELEAPNDHILFEKLTNQVTYRNMKDKSEFSKDISSMIAKLGEAYPSADLRNLYKELYGDEINLDERFGTSNPGSSNMPTSGMF